MTSKNKQNTPIKLIGTVFTILFVAMLIYISVYSNIHKKDFVENDYNKRASQLASENTRGEIISSDDVTLAYTTTDDDGNQTRVYPYAQQFAHVVGYSVCGMSGLEDYANYYLINSNASLSTKAKYKDEGQKFPGDNVYTTINASLQRLCYYSLGDYNGAVIVTNPKTGEILAMVSKPDFDPNTVADDWSSLSTDDDNAPLVNRATQGLYPPGSTFKIMTSLEYIRENPDDYADYSYKCTGSITVDGSTIKCYHGQVHGVQNFFESFANSCNSSFANIGLSLNQTSFADTLSQLLFNQSLPVDFEYKKSSATASDNLSTEDKMQLSIGQGSTTMTPLHLNMITMAIANDGVLMTPYLLDRVESVDGKVILSNEESEYGSIMTSDEAATLTEMMREVVESGTATGLNTDSYVAVGKTGSAEFEDSSSNSHAWFTGFAPADDPEICVTIIMEEAGSGGHMAVPVAKRIFDEYFDVNGVD